MKATGLLAAVRTAVSELGTPGAGETVVVGLSGGPDSVALTDALATLAEAGSFRVVAAHLDHGLRRDAAEDERFCAALCARLGVAFRSGRADVAGRARRERGGIEAAARAERYAFLRRVAREEGAAVLAVAHTRDDQAETFLLRLLRGAGSTGLSAMRPRRGDLIRPLLGVSRAQVIRHLEARGLAWRCDPTNADPRFVRNRVRQELLPYLEARFNPRLREALARQADLLAGEAEVLDRLADELLAAASRRDGAGVAISRERLSAAPRAVARASVRRALAGAGGLRAICASHVERVLDLAASPAASGRRLPLPGGRDARVRFGEIHIGPRQSKAAAFAIPLPVPGSVDLPGGSRLSARPSSGPPMAGVDAAVVAAPAGEPLVVRTRRPGDRIRDRGREISLKRFLMDRRVPADLRAGLPLVASGHRVLWMPGQPAEGGAAAAERLVRLELGAQAAPGGMR